MYSTVLEWSCSQEKKMGLFLAGQGDLSTGNGKISGNFGETFFSADFLGDGSEFQTNFQLHGELEGEGIFYCTRDENGIDFYLSEGKLKNAYAFLENVQLQGEMNFDGFSLFDVKGTLDIGKKIPFHCPIIRSEGIFDIRFLEPLYEIARIAGTSNDDIFM